MYILYIIVLKIKLITNLHALSVAIHVPPNTGGVRSLFFLYSVVVVVDLFNNMIIRSNLWRPPTGYIILTVYHVLAYVLTAKYEEDVPLTFLLIILLLYYD